jgi:hypothetical protein
VQPQRLLEIAALEGELGRGQQFPDLATIFTLSFGSSFMETLHDSCVDY